jgi:hypothetical protein
MKAKPGDRIVITPPTLGGTIRDGEVLEARGKDGGPPFRVRWSDGHEGLIYPAEGRVVHQTQSAEKHPAPEPPRAGAPKVPHVRDWTVRISVYEAGDDTEAHVVLVADSPNQLTASGHSHKGSKDALVPEIGDEVAVARALRHLADQLLSTAAEDIESLTGEGDVYVKAR